MISSDESDAAPVQTAKPNQSATGRTEPDGADRSELNWDGSAPTAL